MTIRTLRTLSPELVRVFAAAAMMALLVPLPRPAAAFETAAPQAILIDDATGTVLFEKNVDITVPPASMSKLMTIYLTFELLAEERLAPDDTFPVSEKAWRMGGSKMFVEVGSRVTIEDLLRGVIIQSGNDACIVLAEGIAGSEEAFAEQMNRKAAELGLMDSYFLNATGWPDEGHVMSVRDIAQISHHLIHDFPDHYPLFAELEFTYSGIRQGNRNPLLYKGLGADGLKTGYTEASGYGLAASVVQNDRRMILVIHGLESVNQRSQEAERLLNYGMHEFGNYSLFEKDEVVLDAEVWLGQEALVPLVLDEALTVTLKRRSRSDLQVAVVYDGPIPAPIEAGEEVAQLVVSAPDVPTLELPLRAQRSIERLSGFGRIGAAINYLLWGPGG
ncbi:MAG: D-alanyl-D-alanine carboxypeptidase family protein [Alphaproteobacteria bacterium]